MINSYSSQAEEVSSSSSRSAPRSPAASEEPRVTTAADSVPIDTHPVLPTSPHPPPDPVEDKDDEDGEDAEDGEDGEDAEDGEDGEDGEDVLDDTDSTLGTDPDMSSTTSVTSSIYEFIKENGRTYHAYKRGKYFLPNDERERERLDLQHELFLESVDRKLFLAPISDNPQSCLDLMTGTGIWAIDFAEKYPSAQVIGTDLSPIQPQYTPPNCRFEIDDAEDEWTFSIAFDFIHARAIFSCLKYATHIFEQAYEALTPGGWFEVQDILVPLEFHNGAGVGSALDRWSGLVMAGALQCGRDLSIAHTYRDLMIRAGFKNVQEKIYRWPLGLWAKGAFNKKIGRYTQEDMLLGAEGFSLKFMESIGWTYDEIQVFLVQVRKDIVDNTIHSYSKTTFLYGQKPCRAEATST